MSMTISFPSTVSAVAEFIVTIFLAPDDSTYEESGL